jgi:hypothetical protein
MQWSKLRTKLRSFVAPNLRSRVDFHLTNYRHHSDHAHEIWITVDKKRVFTASYCNNMIEENVLQRRTGLRVWEEGEEGKRAVDALAEREIHDAGDVVSTFRTYLDLDPQVALTSTDPILRALAIIDRRVGVRTLKELKVSDEAHSLVGTLYLLRLGDTKAR